MRDVRLRIGQLASRADVTVDTIRFYEKRGLLEPVGRSASRYRLFDEEALSRLRFIRRARELGFSLREVGELLELQSGSDSPCEEACGRARRRMEEVESRVADLSKISDALATLILACESRHGEEECPILVELSSECISKSTQAGLDSE